MIDKGATEHGLTTYGVSCDKTGCSYSDEFEAEDWGDLMDQMKDGGWKKSNKSGEWEHICPACAEDM